MKATAQMGGLTREEIEKFRHIAKKYLDEDVIQVNQVCDLALQALSPARVAEGEPQVDPQSYEVKMGTEQAPFALPPSPESPAKEQPGEVAKLIRNLTCADTATVVFAAKEAAALLAKLGQGWIPVEAIPPLAENAYGLQELYARNSDGKCFKFIVPPAPPPERP